MCNLVPGLWAHAGHLTYNSSLFLKLEPCRRCEKAWSQGRTEKVQTRIRANKQVCETFEMRLSVQKQQIIKIKLHSLPVTKRKVQI